MTQGVVPAGAWGQSAAPDHAGDDTLILALDCSTAACTAALFDGDGVLLDSRDEVIGRGHAERLVPMVDELLAGRSPGTILVGVGPGSFTGLRVAIAAAHGMAIGWGAALFGMPTLALLAASAPGTGPLVAAMSGGHGELFVQSFTRDPLRAIGEPLNLPPVSAATYADAPLAVGSGAGALIEARGWGEALPLLPSVRFAMALPEELRRVDARPLYVRAPDAQPKAA